MTTISAWGMRSRLRRQMASGWLAWRTESDVVTAIALTIFVALIAVGWSTFVDYRAAVEYLILTVGVIGLYIYTGGSGIVSFGHVGFMAVGGYCSAIATIPPSIKEYRLVGLPSWLATWEAPLPIGLLVAIAGGALAAAAFGLLIWRLSGIAASIGTLALLLTVFIVASGWEDVTGGRGAVPRVPRLVSLPATLALALATILVAALYQRSRTGRLLRAARDDAPAAGSIGVIAERHRWTSLVLSGAVMGLMGALYVHFVGSISPDFFYVSMQFTLLLMLVVGGMHTLTGAVVGTAAVRILREVLAPLDEGVDAGFIDFGGKPGLRFVVLGIILLLVLGRRPDGLLNGREIARRVERLD